MSFLTKKLFVSGEKRWTAHKAFHFFSITRQFGTLIISIVLSKSAIGLGFIGNYEILLFIGTTFTFFISQGFLDAFNLLFDTTNKKTLYSVYFFSIITSVVLTGFLIGLEAPILKFLTTSPKADFYLLFCIHLFFDFNTWLIPIFLLRKGYRRILTAYAIVANGLWILAVSIPAILDWNPQLIFIGLISVSILKQFFLISILIKNASFYIDWDWGKKWVKKSIPFMGYALLGGLHLIADNWMVGHYFPGNKEIFAIFRYGARELPLSIVLTAAFSTASIPLLQQKTAHSLVEFKKKSLQLIHLFFVFAFCSMLFAKQLFAVFYGPAFELSAHIFGIYLLVIVSRLLIIKPLIMTQNLNHWLVPIAISELLINVTLSYLLVPILGITGIAWGTVVAYSYEKIFMIVLLQVKTKVSIRQYLSVPLLAIYSAIMIISYWLIF